MKFNKIKSFMNKPKGDFMNKPKANFMDGPSMPKSNPKPKAPKFGQDGYVSPSQRMKNKWKKARMDSEMIKKVQKSGDMADTVYPTGLGGTAYSQADMAKRSAIRRKENLKTIGKIAIGGALGGAAGYGSSKLKTNGNGPDVEKQLVDEVNRLRGSGMNDVDFNRRNSSSSSWSSHKKTQRGY